MGEWEGRRAGEREIGRVGTWGGERVGEWENGRVWECESARVRAWASGRVGVLESVRVGVSLSVKWVCVSLSLGVGVACCGVVKENTRTPLWI